MKKLTKKENTLIDLAVKAYVKILGQRKWDSLTDQQKHDAVMIMVNDMLIHADLVRLA